MVQKNHRTPLVVAVLLLVTAPLLYVGSYLALVRPLQGANSERFFVYPSVGNSQAAHRWMHTLFRPLERLDRKLRPESWLPPAP